MHSPLPKTRDLVLAGGGHAHALVLRRWGMAPLPGVRLTLISPEATAPYTGMLPNHIAGHYPREALEIDLVRLARFAGARFIPGRAIGIDRAARRLILEGGREIRYDRLSLDIGVTAALPGLPGYADHATPARPLARIADRWAEVAAAARAGAEPAEIVVIGAGVGGAELALAMAWRLGAQGTPARSITLVDRAQALPGMAPGARRRLMAALADAGIALREGAAVARITATSVELASGESLSASLVVGTPGATPQAWLADTGLHLTSGYVTVDDQLRSLTDPAIYAAGDCAHLSHAPRPKAGVYAVRAAPVLAHNLAADLSGRARRRFHPQADFLRLVALGPKRALAQKWGLAAEGAWVWRWKDRIDRRFMDRFGPALRPMPRPPLPARVADGLREAASGPLPCAGCGAKVGLGTLAPALAALPAVQRDDVIVPPGDDSAILRLGSSRLAISTDHLRAVTEDEALMARIAAHHALGDIYAMGARPQSALASVTLPPLATPLQSDALGSLMQAAAEVFAAAGAVVAGGHTTEGAELTIGFTVTGVLDGDPIGLSGARAGDRLILTKPIGSGTVLAAEMALKARGQDVLTAFSFMQQAQGKAAEILAGAHAMTDVTGFGLAGHLANICRASNLGARLDLAAVPLLPGAEALAENGVRSTLYPANLAAVPEAELPDTPRAALLFDPQTSGGLLAAVAPDAADRLLKDLKDAGYTAALIGEMTETFGVTSTG